jgi:hypothetical protein
MFDLNVTLCDRFPALDPFKVRQQRFHDVLLIFARLKDRVKRTPAHNNGGQTTAGGEQIIRRPAANDDWY